MASQTRRVKVLDSYMFYMDTRSGADTVLFIHGNFSSSATWTNVLPHVQGFARCLAPDLLGMGQSGAHPKSRYHFSDQFRYFDAWTRCVNLPRRFFLVGRDWGAALAVHWASTHQDRIQGLVIVDGLLSPLSSLGDIDNCTLRDAVQKAAAAKSSKAAAKGLDSDGLIETLHRQTGRESIFSTHDVSSHKVAQRAYVTLLRDLPVSTDGLTTKTAGVLRKCCEWLTVGDTPPKLLLTLERGFFSGMTKKIFMDHSNVVKAAEDKMCEQPAHIGKNVTAFIKQLR